MKSILKSPAHEGQLLMSRWNPVVGVACAALFIAGSSVAHAQGSVDLQRYRPLSPGSRGFDLEGTKPLGHLKLAAGLDLNYASQPLRVTSVAGATSTISDAVRSTTAADLLLAIGLFKRFELAVAIPVTLSQPGDAPPGAPASASSGIGDVRLSVRARLWEQGVNGWSLAAGLTATSPLGQSGTYLNSAGPSVEPRLVMAHKNRSFQWGGRLGLRLRDKSELLGTPLGNQLTFALGADQRFGRALHGVVEFIGATPAADGFLKRRTTPVEAILGGRYQWKNVNFGMAAGLGVVSGVGSPAWRILASVGWSNDPPDVDRDSIADTLDACPDDPEDRDGFEDLDGCPDPDNDRDGVFDGFDQCPSDPEDLDDFEDEDGCPELDNDKDGIPDASDKCPNEPETVNEFQDQDGCPDEAPPADKDSDGILDKDDKCPEEAEDKDGFEDEDGCPDLDNDKDGILDKDDKCPLEPETINGRLDDDGCPDEGEPQVRIGEKELETLKPVFFTTNRFRVRHRFWNILDQIALTLKAHPEIGRCAVEGHADATGPVDWNNRLSALRAETVVAYLTSRGVDAKRLAALGHGVQKPWADNETDEGRARNRRVMFHIEGVFSSPLPPRTKKVFQQTPSAAKKPEEDHQRQEKPVAKQPFEVKPIPAEDGQKPKTLGAPEPAEAPVSLPVPSAPAATTAPPVPAQSAKTLREAVRLPERAPKN